MVASIKDYKLSTLLVLAKGFTLTNRIVHGPVTRARADIRAGAGLIITEATAILVQGFGWYGSPALYSDEQAAT
uniref:NADH:flavin oxidoreductase/NADH oxidase N-terminal domain-containing protein n=1 Tax=Globisporangium ultimum (strain ATCC 200006 / CBS 805.95 / DAOM BR144) TaxID=431595 RepID=K3WR30_GLOUD